MMNNKIVARQIDVMSRQESRYIYATLVSLLGDMDLAGDALQEVFKAAANNAEPDNEANLDRLHMHLGNELMHCITMRYYQIFLLHFKFVAKRSVNGLSI